MSEQYNKTGIQKNKISCQFTCENVQLVPFKFSFKSEIDFIYYLELFKRKVQSGVFVITQ